VHLRVGDVERAEAFYRDAVGLDVTRRRHGASFMSSGRYHHHLAGNVWHSAGASRRDESRAGLSWFAFEAADAAAFDAAKTRLARGGVAPGPPPTGMGGADPGAPRRRTRGAYLQLIRTGGPARRVRARACAGAPRPLALWSIPPPASPGRALLPV